MVYDHELDCAGLTVEMLMKVKTVAIIVIAATIAGVLQPRAASHAIFSATPLMDMGQQTYLGFTGGLYENGTDQVPADHATAGQTQATLVRPLDTNGNASPSGKIVLLSVGMSNTTDEFCSAGGAPPCDSFTFMGQAAASPNVNHTTLAIANGAAGGQAASTWGAPTLANYDRVRDHVLAPAGLTEKQVQVVWVKQADPGPTVSLPSSSADAYALETYLGGIMRALKTRYPNVRLVFLSSRIYGGYATTTLNPEPYAYESGFAVKWLIQAQIDQMRNGGTVVDSHAGDLNYNTVAPWIAWGPYLWAAGSTSRSDGLVWQQSDFGSDGTHPATSGRTKVGTMLLNFFLTSAFTQSWFAAQGSPAVGGIAELPSIQPPQPVASVDGTGDDLTRYLAGAGAAFLLLALAGAGWWAAKTLLTRTTSASSPFGGLRESVRDFDDEGSGPACECLLKTSCVLVMEWPLPDVGSDELRNRYQYLGVRIVAA